MLTLRCCETGRQISKSSHARTSRATGNLIFLRAGFPEERCNTLFGAFQVVENVNFSGLESFLMPLRGVLSLFPRFFQLQLKYIFLQFMEISGLHHNYCPILLVPNKTRSPQKFPLHMCKSRQQPHGVICRLFFRNILLVFLRRLWLSRSERSCIFSLVVLIYFIDHGGFVFSGNFRTIFNAAIQSFPCSLGESAGRST